MDVVILVVVVLLLALELLGVFGALNRDARDDAARKVADRIAGRLLDDDVLADAIERARSSGPAGRLEP